ncbi:MAG: TonB-dependent receptor domain-containing protein [Arenicellales bacterium]
MSGFHRLLPTIVGMVVTVSAAAQTDPVVVTATRTAQTVDSSLASVSVIDRKQIETLQPETVAELLGTVPGVMVSQTGGLGQPTAVFLRGSETDHVLVLIDGVKVGSATLGATAFQFIDPDQIERIEIVRGPRSSLYGSDAIGGVIQIFTHNPGTADRASAFLTGGSQNYAKAGARLSTGGERTQFTLSANSEQTDGYNVCKGNLNAGCFAIEDDPDGFENLSLQAGLNTAVGNKTKIGLSFLSSDGRNEFDGSFQNETEFYASALGATVDVAATDHLAVKLSAGQSRDEQDMLKDGVFVDYFDTARMSLSLQNDWAASNDSLVTFGIDYLADEIASGTAFTETARDNLGVFGQWIATVSVVDIQAALRFDDNEQFGSAITGDASMGAGSEADGRWMLQYGTAFKAPTFNELYYPGFGNATLEPEESATLEAGYRRAGAASRWAVGVFVSDVDQLIAYDAAISAPANIDAAEIMGLELESAVTLSQWQVAAALTVLSAEQKGGAYDGKALPRRPGELLEIRADRLFGKWSVGGSVRGAGETYDDLANTRTIGSYAVLDLRTAFRFARQWEVNAKVANLFDEEYEHASFYKQPGRRYFLGVRWRR